jgi:hypothetical protein
MSEENLDLARTFFPATVDVTGFFATPETLAGARSYYEPLVQPEFETVHDPTAIPLGIGTPTGGGVSVGIEGFISLWRDFLSAWESWIVTPTEFIDVDDERVLVLMSFRGRSKTHGVDAELDGGNLLTFHDGKLARLELFFKRRDALAAAGLSE